MINNFKTLIIILVILYRVYNFVGNENVYVPISDVEKSLADNKDLYVAIYINEAKNVAYMRMNSKYGNETHRTSFSNHENFRQMIRNITDDNYKDIDIGYYSNANTSNDLIYSIVLTIVSINIVFSVLKMFFPSSQKGTVGNDEDELLNIFPFQSTSFFTLVKKSDIKFKDVIGLNGVKEDLSEFVKYLQFHKVYKSNGCEVPRGLLFVGPPGVGKTFLAKAFASESNSTFICTSGSSFNEIYMGMGSKRIRQLFQFARKNVPCVIFIDEVDAIGSRTKALDHGELNRTVNALLAEMDGMNDATGIMVIAATNLDELLDPALTRSGRFDKKIVFDHPTLTERIELFKLYLSKIKLDPSFNHDADVKLLAQRTARLTGADIKNICNQAILNHMKQYTVKDIIDKKKKTLTLTNTGESTGCTLKDLNEALDDIGIGNRKTDRAMSEKEKIQVAYHEAGHTLISCLVEGGSVPLKVSIIPRGHSLGYTQPEPVDNHLMFKRELLANICVTLGGRAAERIQFNDITTGASDDLKKVSEMVKEFYVSHSFGNTMHITNGNTHSEMYKSRLNRSMENLINACFKFVCDTLLDVDNKVLLDTIANRLLEKETVNNAELLEIVTKERVGSQIIPDSIQ